MGLISIILYEKSRFFSAKALLYAAYEAEVRNERNVNSTIDDQISNGNTKVRDYYYSQDRGIQSVHFRTLKSGYEYIFYRSITSYEEYFITMSCNLLFNFLSQCIITYKQFILFVFFIKA